MNLAYHQGKLVYQQGFMQRRLYNFSYFLAWTSVPVWREFKVMNECVKNEDWKSHREMPWRCKFVCFSAELNNEVSLEASFSVRFLLRTFWPNSCHLFTESELRGGEDKLFLSDLWLSEVITFLLSFFSRCFQDFQHWGECIPVAFLLLQVADLMF